MRVAFTLAALLAFMAPAMAQPTIVCGYGQPCPNGNPVPFPVINPVQGLSNVLTYPLRRNQPPPPPTWAQAPIATPPPVLPPAAAP
ncbi:MAG TPA: hypothetical protein VNN98_04255 [Rhizomicrobium sp.]|nr:hypothetical protein [Rhizomicrobium sp.]